MKHFKHFLVTGVLLPLLAFSSENPFSEEDDSSLLSLEEELLLLDQEFETLNEELFSLEKAVQSQTPEVVVSEPKAETPLFELQTPELSEPTPTPPLLSQVEPLSEDPTPLTAPLFAEMGLLPKQPLPHTPEPVALLDSTPSPLVQETPTTLSLPSPEPTGISVDLQHAFAGSPVIYSLLLLLSIFAVALWLYVSFSLKRAARFPAAFAQQLRDRLNANHFEEALFLCERSNQLLNQMIASGIHARKHGLPVVLESMKAEGKRASMRFWQHIGMLNDIAIIAPLFGLLGTVLGMFYAFYNVNRSIESISTLFDGLGISVGTTVAGLVVAILALVLHSLAKYKLVQTLSLVESEAQTLAHLIDNRTSLANRG